MTLRWWNTVLLVKMHIQQSIKMSDVFKGNWQESEVDKWYSWKSYTDSIELGWKQKKKVSKILTPSLNEK